MLCGLAQLLAEPRIGHSFVAQVHLAESVEFLIGVLHVAQLVHEPRIPIGIGVHDGHGLTALQRHDDVLHVEHVEHGVNRIAGQLRHIALRLGNGGHQLLHFGSDIGFNQLLITTQFRGVVASDGLMEIRSFVFVERVRREVQHAIVERLVFENLAVGGGHLNGHLAHALLDEHRVVQIALVHHPHVEQTEHGNAHDGIDGAQFSLHREQQQRRACGKNPERAPAVGSEERLAHGTQVGQQRIELFGRPLRERLHLARRDEIREKQSRHQRKQHAGTGGQGIADGHRLPIAIPSRLVLRPLVRSPPAFSKHFSECHHG